jgi:hypothetical protein
MLLLEKDDIVCIKQGGIFIRLRLLEFGYFEPKFQIGLTIYQALSTDKKLY